MRDKEKRNVRGERRGGTHKLGMKGGLKGRKGDKSGNKPGDEREGEGRKGKIRESKTWKTRGDVWKGKGGGKPRRKKETEETSGRESWNKIRRTNRVVGCPPRGISTRTCGWEGGGPTCLP